MSRCTGCPASAAVSAAALYPASMMTSGAARPPGPAACRRRSRLVTCRASAGCGWRGWCARHRPGRPTRCAGARARRRTGIPSRGWSCGCCRSGRRHGGRGRVRGSIRRPGGDRGWRRSRTAAAPTARTPPGPARRPRPASRPGPAPAGRSRSCRARDPGAASSPSTSCGSVRVSSAARASSSTCPAASASYSAPWPRRKAGTSDSSASEVTA